MSSDGSRLRVRPRVERHIAQLFELCADRPGFILRNERCQQFTRPGEPLPRDRGLPGYREHAGLEGQAVGQRESPAGRAGIGLAQGFKLGRLVAKPADGLREISTAFGEASQPRGDTGNLERKLPIGRPGLEQLVQRGQLAEEARAGAAAANASRWRRTTRPKR